MYATPRHRGQLLVRNFHRPRCLFVVLVLLKVEEVFKGDKGVSMKRKRRNVVPDLNSEDDVDGSSVNINQTTSFNSVMSSLETTSRNTK
nr:zinc finger protein CONSTANS-LIKE 5-like [Tanacetum cinerariifolium]